MSLYSDIRGALQVRAVTAAGFPAVGQRAYEGVVFDETIGTPCARMTLIPSSGRPAVVGAALHEHLGLFQIDLLYPSGQGTQAVEAAADAVKAVFAPGGTAMTQGGETVTVRYVERTSTGSSSPASSALSRAIEQGADWLMVSVTVAWRCISPNI